MGSPVWALAGVGQDSDGMVAWGSSLDPIAVLILCLYHSKSQDFKALLKTKQINKKTLSIYVHLITCPPFL